MKMINKSTNNRDKLIVLIVLLSTLVLAYLVLIFYNFKSLEKFNSIILPNVYIEEFDMSGYSFNEAKERLNFYNDNILTKKVKVKINSKDYEYVIGQLGVEIDYDKTINNIIKYQKSLGYSQLIRSKNGKIRKNFEIVYKIDEVKLSGFLTTIKSSVDTKAVDGYFDTSNGVKYIPGVNGYALNVAESVKIVSGKLTKNIGNEVIELVGEETKANSNDSYKTIDTMTSSFVTKFNVYEGTRPINLRTAMNYINGAVVEPGEVFSYYKYAGPYNKSGYVFYYEFVGNGVCQIATTVYNAVLLGGLEVVKRYPHAKKSVYVDGGLDATVASYSSGWNVDFQFKNTYKYPIYIKAYAVGGEAHVEFWSNSQAKEGKTYSTESVKIGVRGYTTYLHTYKDGKELSRDKITTTWYTEE